MTLINPENTEPPAQPPKITLSYYLQVKSASIKLSMDDFNIVRTIGRGSFGKVRTAAVSVWRPRHGAHEEKDGACAAPRHHSRQPLDETPLQVMVVEKKDTGQVYAMKVLSKQHLKDRGEIEHTVSERRILEKHNSPFLVSLKFSFQTPEKVCCGLHAHRRGATYTTGVGLHALVRGCKHSCGAAYTRAGLQTLTWGCLHSRGAACTFPPPPFFLPLRLYSACPMPAG